MFCLKAFYCYLSLPVSLSRDCLLRHYLTYLRFWARARPSFNFLLERKRACIISLMRKHMHVHFVSWKRREVTYLCERKKQNASSSSNLNQPDPCISAIFLWLLKPFIVLRRLLSCFCDVHFKEQIRSISTGHIFLLATKEVNIVISRSFEIFTKVCCCFEANTCFGKIDFFSFFFFPTLFRFPWYILRSCLLFTFI